MKILLIDADSKIPNLALMKISAWHKQKGDEVFLKRGLEPNLPLDCIHPDYTYVSCIFPKNIKKIEPFQKALSPNISIGGYGYSFDPLRDEIEHIMPDYSLYNCDFSIGFTSRGCIRNCPWCVVPVAEGRIRDHAPITEFLHPDHKKLMLLDNNFLASPRWRQNLHEIAARGLKVCFNQGLDIRLVTHEVALCLSQINYRDQHFKRPRLYFAFDQPCMEKSVVNGIQLLKEAGIPPSHLMFYVLVGYNTTLEEDLHRINLLKQEGVLPFVMPYNFRKDPPYKDLARWVNGRYYNFVDFKDYDQKIRNRNSMRLVDHKDKEKKACCRKEV